MIRQDIITKIVDQMKLISSANGFLTEAGKQVFEWHDKKLEEDQYPAIIVRDPSSSANDASAILEHGLKIEIDIATKGKKETFWDMREVSSDILKAFGKVEQELNYRCEYTGSDSLTDHKDFIYGVVRLDFVVYYQSARWEQ